MPRISKPDTHTGDDGTTSTANGTRITKDSLQICAFGAIDELNSVIGVVLSQQGLSTELIDPLHSIQNNLFHLGAELNFLEHQDHLTPHPCIEERHINYLEEIIKTLYKKTGPLQNFALPGGSSSAANLHLARAICRRAEREIVALSSTANVRALALRYLNRLSDALFLMARSENQSSGTDEIVWDSHQ